MAMKASANGLNLAPIPSCYLKAQSRSVSVTGRSLRTSFLNGGVGGLKTKGIKLPTSNSLRCGRRGGALVTQMSLFDGFARVIKLYANASVSSLEDPEKILEQAVQETNDDFTKMRQAIPNIKLPNKYKSFGISKATGEQI